MRVNINCIFESSRRDDGVSLEIGQKRRGENGESILSECLDNLDVSVV